MWVWLKAKCIWPFFLIYIFKYELYRYAFGNTGAFTKVVVGMICEFQLFKNHTSLLVLIKDFIHSAHVIIILFVFVRDIFKQI